MMRYYQKALTRLCNLLANSQVSWIKKLFIWIVLQLYPKINMQEAEYSDWRQYKSFNAFFTRKLKLGVRPITQNTQEILSPAEGVWVSCGQIAQGQLQQIKGVTYSLTQLLANQQAWADEFEGGYSATTYLRPDCYHRVHMPYLGYLRHMAYVPGDLFSVGVRNTQNRSGLFAHNERVVALFETEKGYMAVVMVGAMLVSGIETAWHGLVNVRKYSHTKIWTYDAQSVTLQQGEEMGCFHYGSTVVLLLAPAFGKIHWLQKISDFVKVGHAIGHCE